MSTAQNQVATDPYLQNVWQSYAPSIWDQGKGMNDTNWQTFVTKANAVKDQFTNSFQSLVGRAPTDAELKTFQNNYIAPNAGDVFNGMRSQDPYTYLNQFVGQNYQQAAKDTATQQLTQQQGQANDLSNLFRTQGQQALSTTENSLLDYQQRLFEKLRPQLLTSLQSQGLLDTGGLNVAVAGAQKDLASSVQPWLAQQQLQNDQQANQIAYSGASAPLAYQQSNILNQVPYLQSQGQQAMQQGYNTFLTNLNYNNQLGLQNNAARLDQAAQPSFLRTLGQGFASSFGGNSGQMAAQLPFGAMQAYGQSGGATKALGAGMLG